MKTNKSKQLDDALEYLKLKVLKNQAKMKELNEARRQILLREHILSERANKIKENEEKVKKLFEENQELIKIQNNIITYLQNFRQVNSENKPVKEMISFNEAIELTINGKMPLSNRHPLIDNVEFLEKLLNYYKSTEEYEQCAIILNMIKKCKTNNSESSETRSKQSNKSFLDKIF